jgi:fimbrial isopeptide formation D2 family protein
MQITDKRTKYYLRILLLVALMVAGGVLVLLPSARAQVSPPPTIDKECSPNPVQIGEQLTCTIDVEPSDSQTFDTVQVTDTLPAGVTVSGATQQQLVDGLVDLTQPCEVTGNTVTCPPGIVAIAKAEISLRVTIEATAEQCEAFTNTAEAEIISTPSTTGTPPTTTVEDTEEFTVVGCQVPPTPEPGGQPNQQPGVPSPITQEGEQESEAGEIDQSFEVS